MSKPNSAEARECFLTIARLSAPVGIKIEPKPMTISVGREVFGLGMTARTSTTDGDGMTIKKKVVDDAIEGSSEADRGALLYGWVDKADDF